MNRPTPDPRFGLVRPAPKPAPRPRQPRPERTGQTLMDTLLKAIQQAPPGWATR